MVLFDPKRCFSVMHLAYPMFKSCGVKWAMWRRYVCRGDTDFVEQMAGFI